MNTFLNNSDVYSDKDKQKIIKKAAKYYAKYMDIVLPGWETDPNASDTPLRVAKAFVLDIAKGLYTPFPKITAFDNVDGYKGIVLQSNIPVKSLCSHHHQNIRGLCHVAYIPDPKGKIIGLSKLNRIVSFYSRRPQVQENLTQQIHNAVDKLCEGNWGVSVLIKAKHECCSHRGVNEDSVMSTAVISGKFETEQKVREELYSLINGANQNI
jgi:GTP cyclohydrolase I